MHIVKKVLRIDFVRFCLVGGMGFLVNLLVLSILYKMLHMPLFFSQIIAAEIGLAHNFIWHNMWTYRSHNVKKGVWALVLQFHLTSWVAIVGSAALLSLLVAYSVHYLPALMMSAAAAMMWNFVWSKFVVWRRKNDNITEITPTTDKAIN